MQFFTPPGPSNSQYVICLLTISYQLVCLETPTEGSAQLPGVQKYSSFLTLMRLSHTAPGWDETISDSAQPSRTICLAKEAAAECLMGFGFGTVSSTHSRGSIHSNKYMKLTEFSDHVCSG